MRDKATELKKLDELFNDIRPKLEIHNTATLKLAEEFTDNASGFGDMKLNEDKEKAKKDWEDAVAKYKSQHELCLAEGFIS